MGFKQELKKSRTGNRHELKSLPRNHFTPVLYSIEGEDDLRAVTMKYKDLVPATALKRLQGKAFSPEELLEQITEDEYAEFIHNLNSNSVAALQVMRVKLRYGIGPNNFGDGISPEGALVGPVPVEFVDMILDNSKVAKEMVHKIDELNSPLAEKQ